MFLRLANPNIRAVTLSFRSAAVLRDTKPDLFGCNSRLIGGRTCLPISFVAPDTWVAFFASGPCHCSETTFIKALAWTPGNVPIVRLMGWSRMAIMTDEAAEQPARIP